ncbi:MAG: DUF2182 domain-containing protein, partial [Acidobacteriota bacterium]|nr:DUF2182 domain-containing protein [Acidobacteriota bacterium]
MTRRSPLSLPRRDTLVVLFSLCAITALAWAYLIDMASNMTTMSMSLTVEMMSVRPWTGREFGLMFLMWTIMMVAMMVPTAIPMTLMYAAVARKADACHAPIAPTSVFVTGYLIIWTVFSIVATTAQWGLDQAALLSPMLVTTSPTIGATLLITAGLYQLTPLKQACLRKCRGPIHFLAHHWRPGTIGALRMGVEHGFFCLGCCWILMGLLFLGGVMNLMWIATITLFVLLEKV